MAKMKAMEFTDELHLQPVIRPVLSGRNLDSGLRRRSDPYRKALVYHQPLCGRYSPIQGDSRT